MSAGTNTVAMIPSHAVPGKSIPADVNGEAHPMRPRGGRLVAARARGMDQKRAGQVRKWASPHGAASRALAVSHNVTPCQRWEFLSKERVRARRERPCRGSVIGKRNA